jgi:exopolysaccharide production protein ExoZ
MGRAAMKAPAYPIALNPTLNSIQYLRAVAAVMVPYHHARARLPGIYEVLPNPLGGAGVDLFFVISGFIMVITTAGRGSRPGDFMLRRIARIVPSYWFYTTALALFIVAMPGVLNLSVTLPHYLESIFFVPHVSRDNQLSFCTGERSLQPLLQPGWTLNFEMFF